MKKATLKTMVALAALAALTAFMAPGAGAAELKLGAVSMQRVINESEAGKAAIGELKALAENEQQKFQTKQENFKTLEKDFEQQRLVSRPEVLQEKEQELMRLKREIDLLREDTRMAIQRTQARLTARIIKEAREIITDYAKKNHYTIVLEASEGPPPMGGMVLYADQGVDLTAAVIKVYDDQFKSGAAGKKK